MEFPDHFRIPTFVKVSTGYEKFVRISVVYLLIRGNFLNSVSLCLRSQVIDRRHLVLA